LSCPYFQNIELPLKGKYQKNNAALAALTVSKTLGLNDINIFKEGIKNVSKNTGIQGRYEFFHENPAIIFDSAHNCESVENFLTDFEKESIHYRRKVLLFGAMRDKAVGQMLQTLRSYFDEIVLTEIDYERSAKMDDLIQICNQNNINAIQTNDPANFVRNFILRDKSDCLVVLGSIYLLGEVKSKLRVEVT
jgi:dihydrofolate synthase/folylpolyglutamate synthase